MNRKWQLLKYLTFDFLSAITAWILFFIYRLSVQHPLSSPVAFTQLIRLISYDLILIPASWLFLYYLTGYYGDVFRKSRLSEFGQTISISFIGTLILFFAFQISHRSFIYESSTLFP